MNATGVTAGPAESNGRLLLSKWRDSFHVTCGLTACRLHRDQLRAQRSVTSMGKLYLLPQHFKPNRQPSRKVELCSNKNTNNSLRATVRYWHCTHNMRSNVYETVERPSVRPSVRRSVPLPSIDSSSGVRPVCCWAPRGQEISVDSRRRRSAANAGSVMLTAEGRGWTQTC